MKQQMLSMRAQIDRLLDIKDQPSAAASSNDEFASKFKRNANNFREEFVAQLPDSERNWAEEFRRLVGKDNNETDSKFFVMSRDSLDTKRGPAQKGVKSTPPSKETIASLKLKQVITSLMMVSR